MTQRPDLNTLSKEVFEANKAKGFYDVEVSNETLLMLVIRELSEAVEADRKGKRAKIKFFEAELVSEKNHDIDKWKRAPSDAFSFQSNIKDTVEDELADAVIRLLDLAGLRGLSIRYDDARTDKIDDQTLSEFSFWLINYLFCTYGYILDKDSLTHKISRIIPQIEYYFEINQIDLRQHVSLKLKYNQTRPMKHGKNY